MARRDASRWPRRLLTLLILAGLIAVGLAVFRIGPTPAITIDPALPGIGAATPLRIEVSEPSRGLSDVRVEFVQGDRVELLDSRSYEPLEFWQFWGERRKRIELELSVGSASLSGLREGDAAIRVIADHAGTPIRGPASAVREITLPVKLRPPELQVTSTRTYVTQGGSEAVVYRVGEDAVRHGVRAGEWFFPGSPVPTDPTRQFVLFGAPYDLDDRTQIRLIAEDAVGNTADTAFIDRFNPRPYQTDTIVISDRFLERVVPPIMSRTPEIEDRGSHLANYLALNGELRAANASTLTELAERSKPTFMWDRPFLQMRNAKVMSTFADRRTYLYEGRAVDRQDHLGYDLASTRQAPIEAAGAGEVVLARYFGIYGNAVMIDHGYGLMSLYGHLSSLDVAEGDTVERGRRLGLSGATGLAGGDHLHFTMMLRGLAVDPREWWDGHWIRDRLALKLGPALPASKRVGG